jgi:hypothetical protein
MQLIWDFYVLYGQANHNKQDKQIDATKISSRFKINILQI